MDEETVGEREWEKQARMPKGLTGCVGIGCLATSVVASVSLLLYIFAAVFDINLFKGTDGVERFRRASTPIAGATAIGFFVYLLATKKTLTEVSLKIKSPVYIVAGVWVLSVILSGLLIVAQVILGLLIHTGFFGRT